MKIWCCNLKHEIKKMCLFLAIDFQEDMLQMGVFNSSFGDKFQTDKNFNTENIDRWKEEMPKDLISMIEKNCTCNYARI
jgi:hypothetical protein